MVCKIPGKKKEDFSKKKKDVGDHREINRTFCREMRKREGAARKEKHQTRQLLLCIFELEMAKRKWKKIKKFCKKAEKESGEGREQI